MDDPVFGFALDGSDGTVISCDAPHPAVATTDPHMYFVGGVLYVGLPAPAVRTLCDAMRVWLEARDA